MAPQELHLFHAKTLVDLRTSFLSQSFLALPLHIQLTAPGQSATSARKIISQILFFKDFSQPGFSFSSLVCPSRITRDNELFRQAASCCAKGSVQNKPNFFVYTSFPDYAVSSLCLSGLLSLHQRFQDLHYCWLQDCNPAVWFPLAAVHSAAPPRQKLMSPSPLRKIKIIKHPF